MKRMNGREHAEAFIRIGVPALLFMLAFNIVSLNFDANDNGNLLPNDGIVESAAPELQSGQVFPSSGNQFTTFIFEVVFFDADNDAPSPMNVVLNGTPTAMPKLYSGDTDYTDGCIYRYTHTMPVGNTSFYFTCTAGGQTNTTATRYLIVSATNTAPSLRSPDATPGVGDGTAATTFRVLYIDKENTLPVAGAINVTYNSSTGVSTTANLTQVDAGDTNAVDGKYYSYTVTLTTPGTYQFMFRANDGVYSTATAWISGPSVQPFYSGHTHPLPFYDDFEDTVLGPAWTWTGTAEITAQTAGTGTYSANHHGGAGSITSPAFDTSGMSGLRFDYWLRKGGTFSNAPETGEDMYTEYLNRHGQWVQLERHLGGGTAGEIYVRSFTLPADAFHNAFQVRFRQAAGTAGINDYWHVDDVVVTGPGASSTPTAMLKRPALVSPAHNLVAINGSRTFTWTSMGLPTGAVNYTWQFASSPDFAPSSILLENSSIPETGGTTSVTRNINFTKGTYYWRVMATTGGLNSDWSFSWILVINWNDNPPVLSGMLVTPTSGVTGQTFTYQVVYTDADNNAPTGGGYIQVIIPGQGTFNMNKLYAADVDYTDGCVYTYQYQFATNNTYSANFTCSDGYHVVTTNAITGPVVSTAPPEENDWPFLTNLEATPAAGNSGTTYRFSVRYFDPDNDAPTVLTVTIRDPNGGNYTATMTATPPADTNYVDGRNYHHDNSTLDIIGVYWYRFTFNDSQHEIVSPWIIGPEVTPFFNLNPATLVLPANGSSRANGSATFTWNSLELPCGAVTYTWQLSSRKDFATIVTQNTSIAETATQTSYVQDLQMPAGKYYWRVRASFGGFTQDWSGIFEFTLTRNDFAPVLSNGFVNPTIGTSLDTFTFYVTYTDADNNAPSYVRVYINGTLHAMSKAYDDSVYSDGCIYTFSTASLVVAAYPYRFTFNCSDGTRLGSIGPFTGPTVAAPVNHAPVLVSPNVDPGTGHTGTTFTFLVTYIDIDGDAPSSITVTINSSAPYALSGTDAGDTDVTDGKIYGYSGTLPSFGMYQFRFNASDGSTAVATGWITGPVLVPFPPIEITPPTGLRNYVQTPGYFFNWIDASVGTRLGLNGRDDSNQLVNIPFSFPFYDYTITQIHVCTNGYLSVPSYTAYSNPAFPTGSYMLIISPFWDDLRTETLCNIFTYSPNPSIFIIEWNNYYRLGGQFIGSFQAVLHEDGDIVFNYKSTLYTAGGYTTGLNYGFNTAYYNSYTGLTPATTNFAILYQYPSAQDSYTPTLVAPPNGAIFGNGTIPFEWNSLSLPYNVNYTWQLSNSPSFETITLQNTSIPEGGARTVLNKAINLPKGTYYWRVRATYGAEAQPWSAVRFFSINWNTYAPTLTGNIVTPESGDTNTLFTYKVLYTDADNNAPTYVRVSVDGGAYQAMTKLYPGDNDYTDGCWYVYSRYLTAITHFYQMDCNDGTYYRYISSVNGPLVNAAPVVNNYAPTLVNARVTPALGTHATTYTFSVWFFDKDGNLPDVTNRTITVRRPDGTNFTATLVQTSGGDTNTIDGKQYQYSTAALTQYGTYQFLMNMSDNVHPHVNTGWIAGPTVHPYGGLDGPTLVAPANNSWFAMGNITFTWNSINTNIGWSNYTLQISQDINFTTLAYNNGSVVGTAGTTTITLPLTLERSWVAGLYYWRVQPHVNNTYWGSWSDTWRFSLQANTTAPALSQGKVEPNGGTSGTLLRFTVLYSDIDNNAPLFVRVVINGASYPMAKQDTTDSVYVEEGCVYELAMYLEAGSYEYRFTCGDMTGTADTPAQSFQVTPGSPPGLPVPVPGQPTMEEWITAFVVLGIIAGVAALLVVLATREGGFKKPTLSKPRRPSLSTKTPKTKRPAAGPEFVALDDDASKAAVPGVKPKPVQKPSGVQKPAPAQGSVLRCPHCKSSWQLTPEQFAMYKGKETDCTSCGKKFVPQ